MKLSLILHLNCISVLTFVLHVLCFNLRKFTSETHSVSLNIGIFNKLSEEFYFTSTNRNMHLFKGFLF